MRFITTVASAALALGLTACGSNNKKDGGDENSAQPAPSTDEEKKAQLDQDYSEIPNAAIVRVPVDQDGNATGEPQMMTYKGSEDLASAESAEKAFTAGAAPEKMVASQDELDGDSSTQSWTQWDNYASSGSYGNQSASSGTYYGNGGGYGNTYDDGYDDSYNPYGNSYVPNTYGSNNYYGGWNYNYWQTSYKPVLYYKGYGWNYGFNRPYSYTHGGYSYHCYKPYKYW